MDHLSDDSEGMAAPLTTVVIPVKNEDPKTLAALRYDLHRYGYPVCVVDDGSTVPVVGAQIRFPPPGQGYGAALKAGILKATTDWICTMDGDGQHTAYDVKRMEDFLCYLPQNSMVIGDRRLKETGVRLWGRKVLNWTASCFAGRWIADLNSGLRLFHRSMAIRYFPILCNGFSFTTSLTLACLADGYSVDWLPIKVTPRTNGVSHVRLWKDGWITLRTIVWIGMALRTRKIRAVVRHALGRP